jgi:hypothetical protein
MMEEARGSVGRWRCWSMVQTYIANDADVSGEETSQDSFLLCHYVIFAWSNDDGFIVFFSDADIMVWRRFAEDCHYENLARTSCIKKRIPSVWFVIRTRILSIYLSYLSICLSVCLSVYLPTSLPTTYLLNYPATHPSICLSIYLCIYPSMHPSIYLQPFVGPWPLLQFRNLFYTVGRTPWTGSARRKAATHTQDNTHSHASSGIRTHDPSVLAGGES